MSYSRQTDALGKDVFNHVEKFNLLNNFRIQNFGRMIYCYRCIRLSCDNETVSFRAYGGQIVPENILPQLNQMQR